MKTFSEDSKHNNTFQTRPLIITITCFIFVFLPNFIVWTIANEIDDSKSLINLDMLNLENRTISWQMYTIIFSIYGFNLILPFILNICSFKKIKIDIIPFIYSFTNLWIAIFITWMIPTVKDWEFVTNFSRIFIIVFITILTFIISNRIVNFILANSIVGHHLAKEYLEEQMYSEQKIKELKKINKRKQEVVELEN